MDLGARIGWGVVIYAVFFLAWSATKLYGWTQGVGPALFELLVLLIVCLWAGSQLKFHTWTDIVPYSIGWAVIAVALDGIYAVPIFGWGWYGQWESWIGYALIILFPLLVSFFRRSPSAHGAWES